MSAMLSQPSPDLKAKLVQIEEQLQLAMQEFPERIAIDRLKFALALAKFVRHQLDLDATVEQSIPGSATVGRSAQQ
ncbi:MAG: hypothetical protein E6H57_10745 [Betaproteobacteria bacterium]|nr:MAG: hypothetical protein E6H57_10745 [Betaproteobacteria bacterium]